MKRTILFTTLCIMAMVASFSACSDSEEPITRAERDEQNESMAQLLGTWEVISAGNQPWHGFEEWDPVPIITFEKIGVVKANNGFPPYLVSGTYQVDGSIVKIYADGKKDKDVSGGVPRTIIEIKEIAKNEMKCIMSGGAGHSSLRDLEVTFKKYSE